MVSSEKQWTLAEKSGGISIFLAFLLLPYSPLASMGIHFFFLLCCSLAPFFPQRSFFVPVIARGCRLHRSIALTFDDGPSSKSTSFILDLLARFNVKATFFLIGERIDQSPDIVKRIIREGHLIGNHSWEHDNLLMFRSIGRLTVDLKKTQSVLATYGVRPLTFRPPVGITSPRLASVLKILGMFTVNFSCRAFDRGNRRLDNLSQSILSTVQSGDIVLLHDSLPCTEDTRQQWKDELEHLLSELTTQFQIVPLDVLIGQPVMEILGDTST